MDPEKVNIYKACDRAIQSMNRSNLKDFGKLKLADWDRISIIRTVKALYRRKVKEARQYYYEIATEAYVLGMAMCGIDNLEAHRMAEHTITLDWVLDMLEQTDPVTLYIFEREAERKAERLLEALAAAGENRGVNRNALIDKALKDWTKQLGQYAINVTDEAVMEAFIDAGYDYAEWVTEKDERVCSACRELDGEVFMIDLYPPKPHMGCRCRRIPATEPER